MRLSIDVDELKKSELTFDEYAWLLGKITNQVFGVKVQINLDKLERLKYIKQLPDDIAFRERAYAMFDDDGKKFDEWVEEWRDLFPKGVSGGGGYPIRGDGRNCLTNMTKFIKEYPQFKRSLIMEATKIYVDRSRKEGWKYAASAHYFIIKDGWINGVSKLAAECESYLERGEQIPDEGRITREL